MRVHYLCILLYRVPCAPRKEGENVCYSNTSSQEIFILTSITATQCLDAYQFDDAIKYCSLTCVVLSSQLIPSVFRKEENIAIVSIRSEIFLPILN